MTATLRCAAYTRKSTEEGLDQAFNSLDAQREACEAYIRSQAGEGWKVLPAHYDDGGYSGGNLNRPAMQRLLTDIDAGRVDVIVVYKVDRLTRSLMDFAKIVERLDARGVSFVSVTQAFNTTTSMGRLTLNVLLSFAQFEREVTGERIRDKIAASKAKGIWMGGNVPLGYDLCDRRLVVNDEEAEQVRYIFRRFIELGSGVKLIRDLREKGLTSKKWVARSGRQMGGASFQCGVLYYLLQNRIYLGEIVHRGIGHPGQHAPIVDPSMFDAVQAQLADSRRKRRQKSTRSAECQLYGLLVDATGQRLTTTFGYGRGGRLYRYYVQGSLNPARTSKSMRRLRVPAGHLDRLVLKALQLLRRDQASWEDARGMIERVELHSRSIQLVLCPATCLEPGEVISHAIGRLADRVAPGRLAEIDGSFRLIIDRAPVFRGGVRTSLKDNIETVQRPGLAQALRAAHNLLEKHSMSPLNPDDHGRCVAPIWQRDRRQMALGFLKPSLQRQILEQTARIHEQSQLHSMPLAWADQEVWLNKLSGGAA